jgi:glycosyltransferase involved in cell wall biosynthesis
VPSIYKSNLSAKQARILFFADKVVAISDWTANKLQSLGLENVVRINAGIDLEIFKPTANQSTLRKKFELPLDAPLVLFSGELSRLDSTAIMLAIIRRVVDEDAKIHFVFACPIRKPADTTVRQEVQQKIHGWGLSDSVSFVGEVENFSTSLLNACDMLAYPVARMTGKIDTPLTILEAMSTEMPIILTDLPPLNEVLQAPAGIVVPVGNEKAFAHAIIELSNDENLRREMGQIGREVVEAHYNLAAMAQAYEDLYDELT